jgi:hypothetical protein
MNKNVDAGTNAVPGVEDSALYQNRTEIQDAGMPMLAASASMPMSSYGK